MKLRSVRQLLKTSLLVLSAAVLCSCRPGPGRLQGESPPASGVVTEEEFTARARENVAFDTWQGKGGAVLAKYDFQLTDFPRLAGYRLESRDRFPYEGKGMIEEIRLSRADGGALYTLRLQLGHSTTSVEEAQEMLLGMAIASSQIATFLDLRPNSGSSLGVGDYDFGAVFIDSEVEPTYVALVQNNTACLMDQGREVADPGLDLVALSREIVARILAQPTL